MTTLPTNPTPKRRLFQISLFSLGLFITVVCLGLGWPANKRGG